MSRFKPAATGISNQALKIVRSVSRLAGRVGFGVREWDDFRMSGRKEDGWTRKRLQGRP